MSSVLKHDYLRKSMVDRIERKSLLQHYRQSQERENRERRHRPTKTQLLRNNLGSNKGTSSHLQLHSQQFSNSSFQQSGRSQHRL